MIGLLAMLMVGCGRPASKRGAIRLSLPTNTGSAPAATTLEETKAPIEEPQAELLPSPLPGATILTPSSEAGAISGQLRWVGTVQPATPRLHINLENQGIADAVVSLVQAPPTQSVAREVQLYHKKPSFLPHVLAVPRGSTLKMLSTDAQGSFQAHGAMEFSCTAEPGKPQSRTLDQVGHIMIRSDADPNMLAHVWVFDHPYVAVTDESGRFRLPDVPPGKYQVKLWHEGWRGSEGTDIHKTATVQLGQKEGANVEFSLTGRDGEKK
jgi:hypothetical protein